MSGWRPTWIRCAGGNFWREHRAGLPWIMAAAVLVPASLFSLERWQALIAWAIYGAALTVASWQGWIHLFGPVLFYDMVRSMRRSRYLVMRLLYASLLLMILGYMYLMLNLMAQAGVQANLNFQRRQLAQFGESFFATFMLVQLAIVTLLTPAYVAGAIAEEKERKTLEFLLATDLSNREIVLSKLLSRLANMTLLLLTGLPILSMLQFVGGVDQELMLAGFAGTGLTMLGIASLSILLSTLFKRPRDAIALTYLLMVAYVSFSTTAMVLGLATPALRNLPIWFGAGALTLGDAAGFLHAGNPLVAIMEVTQAIRGTGAAGRTTLAAALPGILQRYAGFHLLFSGLCLGWSIARVRVLALAQSSGGAPARLRWWQHYRPAVGNLPMLWKEFYIEGRTRFNWLIWIALTLLILLTLGTGLYILGVALWSMRFENHFRWDALSEGMNIWFRVAGTSLACLLLLMMAVRASTAITSERERDTFDALIITPMSCESILAAKVLGNVLSLRLGWLWYGSMILLAVGTGGLHPLAVPLLIAAWMLYALTFTMIGLWFSMICKSSTVATLATVPTVLFLGGGHWLITGCCCAPLFGLLTVGRPGIMPPEWPLYFLKVQAGCTPPVVFAIGSFSWTDLNLLHNERQLLEWLGYGLLGILLWFAACVLLWFAVLVPKFRQLTRRDELVYD